MTDKEKRLHEERIRALEASKREFENMHPDDTYRIQAMQNEIDGLKKYVNEWK